MEMTIEEARKILLDVSYALGNMGVEYLSEKDGEKMREAIKALEQQPIFDIRQRERQLEMEYQHGYDKGWEEGRKALKQQPSEDCISRQAAIDVVKKWFDLIELNSDICVDGLISLPSVQPQPKKGKWEVIRKEYEFMGSVVNEPQGCKCSNCGGIVKFKSDFCPNCGANMRESENKE